MKSSALLLLTLCVLVPLRPAFGDEELRKEGLERLEEFYLNAFEIGQSYSVVGRIASVRPKKLQSEEEAAEFSETIFRKARIHRPGTELARIDLRTASPLMLRSTTIFEHDLIGKDKLYFCYGTKLGGDMFVRPKGAQPGFDPLMTHFDPVRATSAGGSTFLYKDEESELLWKKMTIHEATVLRDDRFRFRALNDLANGVTEVIFASEPKWAIVEIKNYGNFGKAVEPSNFSLQELKNWKVINHSQTSWDKVKDDLWVPKKSTFWQNAIPELNCPEETTELRLEAWKLGDDVPRELFDESKFTKEEIIKTINFQEWEQLFVEPKRR